MTYFSAIKSKAPILQTKGDEKENEAVAQVATKTPYVMVVLKVLGRRLDLFLKKDDRKGRSRRKSGTKAP